MLTLHKNQSFIRNAHAADNSRRVYHIKRLVNSPIIMNQIQTADLQDVGTSKLTVLLHKDCLQSSEIWHHVEKCQSTWYHIPDNTDLHQHCCDTLASHTIHYILITPPQRATVIIMCNSCLGCIQMTSYLPYLD